MPVVKRKYVYFTCISCGKEKYKTVSRYEKLLKKFTPEELDATFKCLACKKNEKSGE